MKFPGEIKRSGYRKVLNGEQLRWLRRWYPVTENNRLAKAMSVSRYKVLALAKEHDLHKSEKGLKAIKHRQAMKAAKTNERNGCYDRKRGHPASEATMRGVQRRWQEERMGLRENVFLKMKREEPKKYQAFIEKRSEERKELIRKEKMRMIYGLERKTSIKPVVLSPYKKSQVQHRHNALKRGYILNEDCSEGSPDRFVIYYDEDTERNKVFERNCINDGFKIKEWL